MYVYVCVCVSHAGVSAIRSGLPILSQQFSLLLTPEEEVRNNNIINKCACGLPPSLLRVRVRVCLSHSKVIPHQALAAALNNLVKTVPAASKHTQVGMSGYE